MSVVFICFFSFLEVHVQLDLEGNKDFSHWKQAKNLRIKKDSWRQCFREREHPVLYGDQLKRQAARIRAHWVCIWGNRIQVCSLWSTSCCICAWQGCCKNSSICSIPCLCNPCKADLNSNTSKQDPLLHTEYYWNTLSYIYWLLFKAHKPLAYI